MQRFNGEGIQQMFYNLKIPQNEPITGGLVNQTIANTQKRLAQRVPQEQRASSAAEWFRINLPA
jgi:preprotein translocase subunit SecA